MLFYFVLFLYCFLFVLFSGLPPIPLSAALPSGGEEHTPFIIKPLDPPLRWGGVHTIRVLIGVTTSEAKRGWMLVGRVACVTKIPYCCNKGHGG
jgi:hypothetical protein